MTVTVGCNSARSSFRTNAFQVSPEFESCTVTDFTEFREAHSPAVLRVMRVSTDASYIPVTIIEIQPAKISAVAIIPKFHYRLNPVTLFDMDNVSLPPFLVQSVSSLKLPVAKPRTELDHDAIGLRVQFELYLTAGCVCMLLAALWCDLGSCSRLGKVLVRAEVRCSFITTTVRDESQVTPQWRHR